MVGLALMYSSQMDAQNTNNKSKNNQTNMNVLIEKFNTPYGSAPFKQIKITDYKPAFEFAIKEAKNEIDEIANNTNEPTFENTIEALDFSGQMLGRIRSIFFNLNSAETSPEMQKLAQELSPMLTAFGNDITLNEKLFARIQKLHNQRNELSLNQEQIMLLEKNYKNFARNGALLNNEEKEKLRSIDKGLSTLALTFGENVLAETQGYFLQITNQEDLKGLPESVIEAAKGVAKSKNLEGWVFTLDYPSYVPFMTYAENRKLRKEMAIAFGSKGFKNNANDNQELVKKIAILRFDRAKLLGYDTHSHFVLEERMAQNPNKVHNFLNDLKDKATPAAKKEHEQLSAFAKKIDGIEVLERWDTAYYSEKLKQELFNLDNELLKPYFELNNVLQGAFTIANKLFDLNFKEVKNVDIYHPDVKTFEVTDANGAFIALFYTDFHPRKGKRNGAWMTSFKNQYIQNGTNERPHVANVCNFTPPTETKPSLLSFNEVTTLFHEFGHGLHGMMANTKYPGLSGTSVFWDFVELPSQIMENWCYEPEALSLFAKHYQTGELLPQIYIEKIKESASFMQGTATLRQVSLGLLDMAYHSQDPSNIQDIKKFELKATDGTSFLPDVKENLISTSFSHIFAGGYSSGYYSYKWAEVLDADAFAYFQEKGIFNKEVAKKFQDFILSKGGTEHPMSLYKKFRGQEPQPDALLKRSGLMK